MKRRSGSTASSVAARRPSQRSSGSGTIGNRRSRDAGGFFAVASTAYPRASSEVFRSSTVIDSGSGSPHSQPRRSSRSTGARRRLSSRTSVRWQSDFQQDRRLGQPGRCQSRQLLVDPADDPVVRRRRAALVLAATCPISCGAALGPHASMPPSSDPRLANVDRAISRPRPGAPETQPNHEDRSSTEVTSPWTTEPSLSVIWSAAVSAAAAPADGADGQEP